jgi:hypothetical protein
VGSTVDDPDSSASFGQQTPAGENFVTSLVGTIVADRYRVEQLLGEGGMGAVYRAQHIHMQKDVALKVLHQSMSSNQEVVKRFEREAVAAAKVMHPNVAGASDFGRLSDGSFYLVLEYIRGQSLGDLIDQAGTMDPERACRIAMQIASALSAAHNEGIVHRDLKPENVMLPQGDHEGDIVKVLDFGMAKMQQTEETQATKLTMHGAVYGTPAYMAPEQAAGNEVDHRADLYALGLMLYEMVAGRPPFISDQVMALLVKQMTETPAPLPASVPPRLQGIVMKLLEKQPDARYQSADELIRELSDYLGITYRDPRLSAVGIAAPLPSAPRQSAPSVAGQMASKVAQVGPLLEKARQASRPAVVYLKQPMTVKGQTFPRWIPAAVALGFFLVLFVMLVSGGDEATPAAPTNSGNAAQGSEVPVDANPAAKDPDPPDPELAKVITAAAAGSDSALYALEQRKDEERSLTEWMGLAQARLMRKKIDPALAAYKEAINRDASMKADKQMIGALRKLADDEAHAEKVLDFVAEELGNLGADLLFDVWAKTSLKTRSTTIAYDHLTSSAVEGKYSPALAVAMKLRDVKDDCEDSLKLMPEIERVGDDRSMTVLRGMLKKRGCGNDERKDCYPCMRKGKGEDALQAAIQAAAMRSAPRYELSNFRFKD